MKIENIPAEIKSKSLKEAREEINEILLKLESDNYDLKSAENIYKRLIYLNKHVETVHEKIDMWPGPPGPGCNPLMRPLWQPPPVTVYWLQRLVANS